MGVNPRAPHGVAPPGPFSAFSALLSRHAGLSGALPAARHRPVPGREGRKREGQVRHPSVSNISSISFAS